MLFTVCYIENSMHPRSLAETCVMSQDVGYVTSVHKMKHILSIRECLQCYVKKIFDVM